MEGTRATCESRALTRFPSENGLRPLSDSWYRRYDLRSFAGRAPPTALQFPFPSDNRNENGLSLEFELEEYEAIGWLSQVAYGEAPKAGDTSYYAPHLLHVFDKLNSRIAKDGEPVNHAKRLQQLLAEGRDV